MPVTSKYIDKDKILPMIREHAASIYGSPFPMTAGYIEGYLDAMMWVENIIKMDMCVWQQGSE